MKGRKAGLEILDGASSARRRFRALAEEGAALGFVPTMGALHEGHLSLVRRAKEENDLVAVSIFVNPTQFDDPSDLERYPRDLDADRKKLEDAGADYLFYPSAEDMYPEGYRYKVSENRDSRLLEGAHREGHFDGVLTVVLKLLGLVGARRAYFGEKDWQQYRLVKGMAEDFFLDTEIVPCPLVRESDGLAMSSRNALLTPEQRALAPAFHRILSGSGSVGEKKEDLEGEGFEVDYVEEWDGRCLGAVRIGKVRLIDNVGIR